MSETENEPAIQRSNSDNSITELSYLRPNEVFSLVEDVAGIKIEIEWTSPHNGMADLDVFVLLYDENVSILGADV